MFVDWLLASFHHLAVFSLAAILSAEIFLTAGPIDDSMALRVARLDAWFGLVAAIVVAAGCAAPTLAELRAHVASTLPAKAAPREVHLVDELPRRGIGKVNRRELSARFSG